MKIFNLIMCILISMTVFSKANAQLVVHDPIQTITLGMDLIEQLDKLKEQTDYLKTELKDLTNNQYQWGNAQNLINQLGTVVSQTNGISYSAQDVAEQFQSHFPGYQPPQNFEQQYQQNANATVNTLDGILQSMGMSAKDFSSENTRLQFLQSQVQNSAGQMQAIQASSQIASEMVSQIQLLRQTVQAQTNAQAVYFAQKTQTEASSQAQLGQIIKAGSTDVPKYGSSGNNLTTPDF